MVELHVPKSGSNFCGWILKLWLSKFYTSPSDLTQQTFCLGRCRPHSNFQHPPMVLYVSEGKQLKLLLPFDYYHNAFVCLHTLMYYLMKTNYTQHKTEQVDSKDIKGYQRISAYFRDEQWTFISRSPKNSFNLQKLIRPTFGISYTTVRSVVEGCIPVV